MFKNLAKFGVGLSLFGFGSITLAAGPTFIPPSLIREVGGEKPNPAIAGAQKTQERITLLGEKALLPNWDEAFPAIKELKGMGAVARPTLIATLKTVLTRDQQSMQAAIDGIGDGKESFEYESQIDALRAQARDNVKVLDKAKPETIKKAHEFYDKLMPMTAKMNQAWAFRLAIIDGVNHRAQLMPMWREVAPSNDQTFPAAAETKLKESASRAVGDFASRMADLTWAKAPTDPALKPLWFFGMSRKIEAFNEPLAAKFMDAEEINNLKFVNNYREAIGLLPLEADVRLLQAARRHSKSMVDLKFFAHDGPVEGNKSPSDRMKNAGYPGGGGENIAMGPSKGEPTFWMWFDSPGHHKNMAGGYTSIGVGRWQNHFTQNFAGGPRVMLMKEEEQAKVKIGGNILDPNTPVSQK